ncbi:uncharacterized protein LOC143189964 isoform X1 [Rhynchophorus ferrugineus]|uniref:uncharacterized protein LOC143189964 isoform X1 n=1 Tax=Rhynchophorus ferrugineus TaxID=354439 RepID=UPI003FCDD9E6
MDVSFNNVLEGARQYFQGLPSTGTAAGPYFQHQQNVPQRQPTDQQHHGTPSPGTPSQHWQQHATTPDTNRSQSREQTSVQRSPSVSRPPSHPGQYQDVPRQYHGGYTPERQNAAPSPQQLGFMFTRPQSRETPTHQYQPHIVTTSPYHLLQSETPQVSRAPSRESVPAQSYQQAYQAASQYPYPPRSYQQPQPKSTTTYTSTQSYQTASPQGAYYKQKSYPTATPVISSQPPMYHGENRALSANVQQGYQNSTASTEQTYRRTHNLPPIAELSNYHSSRNIKDPNKVTLPRARLPSSSSYSHVTSSAPVQQSASKRDVYSSGTSSATYNHYRVPVSQHTKQQIPSQVSSQAGYSYSNVIMTLANTSHYATTSSQQATASGYYNRPKAEVPAMPRRQTDNYNRANVINEPSTVIKQKRESPLDLSVKTVRTSADSTEEGETSTGGGKHGQNKVATGSLSSHDYPTLDINTIQRNLTNRSQSATVTAPKVEFQPNFNLPRHSGWPSTKTVEEPPLRKTVYEQSTDFRPDFRQAAYKEPIKTHYQNGHVPAALHALTKSTAVRTDYSPKIMSVSPYEHREMPSMKRPADVPPQVIPNKIPKVENWRQSIDFQIEQKLSEYTQQHMLGQQHHQQTTVSTPISVISQICSEPKYQLPQPYSKQTSAVRPIQIPTGESGSTNHQYSTNSAKGSSHMYLNQAGRSSHNALIPTTSRQPSAGAVDKRVLNLLRNSIEVKEQKKLEQQKSHEVVAQRSDVQQPSTDVKAPFQPKPGIDRNNVSPVPPTSVQEIKELAATANNVMNGSSSEITYLETFLEIRVRTKGELKQLHSENNNSSSDAIIQVVIDPMKSPQKPTIQHVSSSSSTTSGSTSPPKLLKERQPAVAPRKRLFSRTEDDSTKNGVPTRDKSGLRSSSETSIFDFPDSDDDNEMPVLERQSLGAMRRDRRNSLKPTGSATNIFEVETKTEPESPPESQEEDIFGSICDTFVEQMKKTPIKRVKRRRMEETDCDVQIKKEEPSEMVTIKTEPDPEPVDKSSESIDEGKTKCEPESEEKVPEVLQENERTPITTDTVKTDTDSDSEIKKDDRIAIRNKRRVRRKVLSSSDSSDNEEEDEETEEKKPDLKELEAKLEEANRSLNETKLVEDPIEQTAEVKTENVLQGDAKVTEENTEQRRTSTDSISMVRPATKPLFGDGSDFYPGWEEEVYNYKKSLRMPPSLIQVTRPPTAMRLSTSLPDLDPCPQSPTPSVMTDVEKESALKRSFKKFKSEPIDSDSESTSSFNLFGKKTNYDSEGSSSVRSLPNTKQENQSILDRLLEKCGGKKKRKSKRKEDHSPKLIPKADNPVELLPTPTPGLEPSEKSPEKSKGLTVPVINAKSAVLPFRKDTVNTFKDAFINSGSSILGVHDKFTTIVLTSRTRKETRAMKQRATIKEVFGEDRPASAPPVTCVNDVEIKNDLQNLEPFSKTLEEILIKKETETITPPKTNVDIKRIMKEKLNNTDNTNLLKDLANRKIKEEILEDDDDEDENKRLIEFIKRDSDARSETASLDGDDSSISGKRRSKLGKIRRKFSSGFDYIRKKKKAKKEEPDMGSVERKKRVVAKTPESIDDIQKEIKSWVLNKGIGETHLHRAARLGYADITAYCLEKMDCPPSPRDNAGYTPLHEASVKGHLDIAKLLLRYGANVHESAQGGIRPLHEAVESGFVEIVRLLLSYGADPALATYAGVTPLSLATDDATKKLLKSHLTDKSGENGGPWQFNGPASCFDPEQSGYDILDEVPKTDSDPEIEDIEVDMSETLPPNLYTLRGEPPTERWVLLQDLSNQLKIKSRDALLRQIAPPSIPNAPVNYKSVLRELKMTDFLEQAHCCQFLNMGEKINTRATKIALVKYTDKVKELLGIETTVITAR